MTQWGHPGRHIRRRPSYAGIALTILCARALSSFASTQAAETTATRAIPEQERRSQLDSTYRQPPGTAALKRETRSRCLWGSAAANLRPMP